MGMKVTSLGENHGDCFFIEISNEKDTKVVMVDGRKGDEKSYLKIRTYIMSYDAIDYIVLTHVDDDHIHGLLKLFQDVKLKSRVEKAIIIYNYVSPAVVSYRQAEMFEELIQNHTVISTTMRNYTAYGSGCIKLMSYEMRRELEPDAAKDYAVMTLLHPDWMGIKKVYKNYSDWKKWDMEQRKNGDPTNHPLINQNSIAFMIEYNDHRVLFTGDGVMSMLIPKIEQLKNMGDKKIDLIKVAHHGAKVNNEGLQSFAEEHNCHKFLITGKKEWDGKHPDEELVKELRQISPEVKIYTNVKKFNEATVEKSKKEQQDIVIF